MAMRLDDAIFDAILADIAGHGNAKRALRDAEINPRVFWAAINADVERANRYARAKERGMESVADEMLDIADESRVGKVTKKTPKGLETTTADMVERSRLQVDTRKWLLARLIPKKYGDRQTVDLNADHTHHVHADAVAEAKRKLFPDAAEAEPGTLVGKLDADAA